MKNPEITFSDALGYRWRFTRAIGDDGMAGIVIEARGTDDKPHIVVIPEQDVEQFVESVTAAKRLPRMLKPRG